MAQEQTPKMRQPLADENEVRPYDTVTIVWAAGLKHKKEGEEEEVHQVLGEKMVAAGKATYKDGEEKVNKRANKGGKKSIEERL
jgi:hypothetical protein